MTASEIISRCIDDGVTIYFDDDSRLMLGGDTDSIDHWDLLMSNNYDLIHQSLQQRLYIN